LNRVIYRRGSAIPIKNSFINRYFFKHILTEVLANSEATKKTINEKNESLFPKTKITVIPNAIDIQKFDNLKYESLYVRQDKEIILGNLGRMVYQKNQEFLIDVSKELMKRQLNFMLLIGGDGKLKEKLQSSIEKSGLKHKIKLLGFINNPKSFMNSIDIFLLPSRWEGFGYVIAEAMLCNKPTIAFDISSNSQLINDRENGFLIPFGDVKQFCDQIDFFAKNLEKLAEMGGKGREKIENEFRCELIQAKVMNYLLR